MKGIELLERMDLIDSELVEAADVAPRKRKGIPKGVLAAAACFCLMMLGMSMGLRPATPPVPTDSAEQTIPSTVTVPISITEPGIEDIVWSPHYNEYAESGIVADGKRVIIPGYFTEELTEEEIQSLIPTGRMLWMEISGYAGFNREGNLIDLFLTLTTPDPQSDISLFISRYGICDCYIVEGDPEVSLCGNVAYTLYQRNSRDCRTYFDAETEMDGWFWSFSMDVPTQQAEQARQYFQDVLACYSHALEQGQDYSGIQPEYIPDYFDLRLSHAEAAADPTFGRCFLPDVPHGYTAENIRRYLDYQNNYLSGLWFRGYDELYWYVSEVTEGDRARIIAVADVEHYDLSLYPIPRAESVPESLREIVDNPIFLAQELTLDAVKARAYRINDAGDTDGWRMHFSVLYGDILIEIRTKGVDPEWVYEQLIHIFSL